MISIQQKSRLEKSRDEDRDLFLTHKGLKSPSTWRIIPFSKWLITMVSKSPK